ncbi:MAG: FMN-binding protein [Treponema sp.]|nr:FMN-binding protein [Treponema sp.]
MKIKYLLAIIPAILLLTTCVNLDEIVITNPDLSGIADGVYQGNSKVGPVRVTLDVTMRENKITSIEIIKHFNGRGKEAEAIIPRIIQEQSLQVDVISGATASSKAFLLAVEDALNP